MFDKFWYDDTSLTSAPEMFDLDLLKGKIIKIVVQNKTDPYRFDRFIEELEKVGILEMQIVEDHLNLGLESEENIISEAESTIDIFKSHIGQINDEKLDKLKLEKMIVDLYQEALSVE
jgi:hypothetical protein